MGTVQRIVKDALGAIIFLAIAGALLIYFLGYPGLIATEGLALIFLVCFVALRFAEIAGFIVGKTRQRQEPPPAPPSAPQPSAPPQPQFCPKCGSAWVPGARTFANCG